MPECLVARKHKCEAFVTAIDAGCSRCGQFRIAPLVSVLWQRAPDRKQYRAQRASRWGRVRL